MASLQINFDILLLLLKASSKQQVLDIVENAFKYREKELPPNQILKPVADSFEVDTTEASKLFSALGDFIKFILFNGYSTYESIISLFPEDFHKNLRDLVSKIFIEKFSSWKTAAITNSVSVPRLVEYDWRVDLKMASGKIARMSEPTCILNLKVLDPVYPENQPDHLQTLNVELSKEKLDTMLHGLGRIRDQLSAVSKK
ncbi:COMM domain-containing protein 9 [Parasteatoda tepidariorum]|uniref:COMM domain-containing protein 9 n=1 Tax=Parasteatoda tepidariorum TaxID=114398 RepID=UPI00077FCD8D|nr:COMM domain-containing protein 9 [Parasteatoda tepidariorum]